ncbi:MAG: hypothetical protein KKA60_11990 [Proteobacteria bacterium]|nr:hypothetical protein [Pseudomonadota bacterium]
MTQPDTEKTVKLMEEVLDLFEARGIPISGAASAARLDETAPPGFRPSDLLPGAKTVLIMARPLPVSVFQTEKAYDNAFYVNAFAAYYGLMDEAASAACLAMERQGFASLPVPSYAPLRFVDGEPRGVFSLKHAAVEAGLGLMGKNSLLIHPEHGNVLRLGGLITTMEWPAPGPGNFSGLCPEKCNICQQACPVGAIDHGRVDKMRCMGNCIRHVLLPPARLLPPMKKVLAKSPRLTRLMELFAYNLFGHYGIACTRCLVSCPRFPGNGKKKVQGQAG